MVLTRHIEQADEDWLTPFEEDITTPWDFTAIHVNTDNMDSVKADLVYSLLSVHLQKESLLTGACAGPLLGQLRQQTHLGHRVCLCRQYVFFPVTKHQQPKLTSIPSIRWLQPLRKPESNQPIHRRHCRSPPT